MPPGIATAIRLDLDAWPIVHADRQLSDGRHLVLGDIDGPHHLWIRAASNDAPLAYLIFRDEAVELRRLAAARLDRRLAGAPPGRAYEALRPSAFQRHRLSLLLAILDCVLADGSAAEQRRATTREVAATLVYPRSSLPSGAAWKASSERRRTQRLIDEAMAMMRGGYLALLRGKTAVRQKAPR